MQERSCRIQLVSLSIILLSIF